MAGFINSYLLSRLKVFFSSWKACKTQMQFVKMQLDIKAQNTCCDSNFTVKGVYVRHLTNIPQQHAFRRTYAQLIYRLGWERLTLWQLAAAKPAVASWKSCKRAISNVKWKSSCHAEAHWCQCTSACVHTLTNAQALWINMPFGANLTLCNNTHLANTHIRVEYLSACQVRLL